MYQEDDDEGDEAEDTTILQTGTESLSLDQNDEGEDDFTSVLPAHDATTSTVAVVRAIDIDVFWLQRNVSIYYPDAVTAQAKTIASFDILELANASIRDVENGLMELYEYEKFDLVKLLTQNRDLIVWCTRLQRAEGDEEKAAVEQDMRDAALDWILTDLKETKVTTKITNGAAKQRESQQEDDVEMEHVAPVATSQPKQTVDLQALAFEQGGHFMSNKKVKLPEGSFKRSKKGYEEVHVPAPKPKPMGETEKLRPITSLPNWAQNAFSNAKSLNRIQSKVYPTAFESDENMLLCAPTGAGK